MKKNIACLFTLPFLILPAMAAWQTDFSSVSQFNTDFPTQLVAGGGNSGQGDSSVSVDTGTDQLALLASNNISDGVLAYATTYTSASLSSEFDLFSGEKTISLVNSDMTFSGGGNTYRGVLGVFSEDDHVDPVPATGGDAFYLYSDRTVPDLKLIQRIGGVEETVWTQSGGISGSIFILPELSISVSATDWSISGVTDDFTSFSGSGSFTNPFTAGSWGSDHHLGISAILATASPSRTNEYRIDSIAAIPEPRHYGLAFGAVVLLGLIARRFRNS